MSEVLTKCHVDFSKERLFLIITGGSRGFGKTLATCISKTVGKDSMVVLIARNKGDLERNKTELQILHPDINFKTMVQDLATINGASAFNMIKIALGSTEAKEFKKAILIHNAGSLGCISKTVDDLDNLEEIQSYYNLNVHSVFMLTSAFLKIFCELRSSADKCFVINISSLAATTPFCGWAQYCSGKAARELYFKVLSSEFPNVKVLNYAPGPVETDMTDLIINDALPSVKEWFINARAENKLVSCEDSCRKLLNVLQESKYNSGDHVDYFD